MKLLLLMSLTISTLLTNLTHPVSMVIMISLQSFIMSLILWVTLQITWFSFILFLIFMGGLMILFMYTASLASNEKFEINLSWNKFNQAMLLLFTLSTFIFLSPLENFKSNLSLNIKTMIFKMFSLEMTPLIMMSILYLLIVLIIMVNIIKTQEGSLRQTK